MEKETLEDYIEREGYHEGPTQEIWAQGVREGAKWAQEKMYSEEEVLTLLQNFNKNAMEYIEQDDRSIMTLK